MKILHITTSSRGGAGIAALRLHNALRDMGVASAFISTNLSIDFEGNQLKDPIFSYTKLSLWERILRKLKVVLFPSQEQKLRTKINSIDDKLDYEMISLPFSRYELHLHPLVQEATILNFHLMTDMLDYSSFFTRCKKAVVWTLHDMNPFLGLFHYRGDEVRNLEHVNTSDAFCRKLKASAIGAVSKGAIISPSKWLLEEAEESDVFANFSIKRTIPNAINLDVFKIMEISGLRNEHAISEDDFVVLFISDKLDNFRKGIDLLADAFAAIPDLPITVLTVGEGKILDNFRNLKIVPLGRIAQAEEMAKCYNMADVFLLPSREDNLPNVMLESFACGCPVVSFEVGGMMEHINEFNGRLVKNVTGEALAAAIRTEYKERGSYDRHEIRKYAVDNFSFQNQAQAYTETYNELIK